MTGHFIPKWSRLRLWRPWRLEWTFWPAFAAPGILPYEETVNEIRRPEWRETVDACQMLTSVAYQILRDWHDLPPVPYIGREFDYINEDPFLEHI